MRRHHLSIVALATVALFVAACGDDDEPTTAEGSGATEAQGASGEPVVIGAVFDLSGATADVGTPYAEGARDYVEFVNSEGGAGGRPIELMWQDYQYDVAKAEQLYSQFVSEGAVAFLGWGTGDTEALRSRIASDEIPFMSGSYSADLANPAEAPFNFVVAPTYSHQLIAALDWIAEDAGGPTEVAVFHHDSPFGQSPLDDGEAYVADQGLDIGFASYPMPAGGVDFFGVLSQAESQGAEYVVVQNVSSPAALLAKNIAEQGLNMKFVCLNWCADEQFIQLAGAAAEGAVGIAPFAPPSAGAAGNAEAAAFLESKGGSLEDNGTHYVQGWHTAALMVHGIEEALSGGGELTGPAIRDALEEMEAFDTGGVTPPIDFSADDHEGMKTSPLYVVESGQWVAMEP